MSQVKVSLAVEVSVAHVGAAEFTDDIAVARDPAAEIVAGQATLTPDRCLGGDTVCLVLEFHRADELVMHLAEQGVSEDVVLVGVMNAGPVGKFDKFVSAYV